MLIKSSPYEFLGYLSNHGMTLTNNTLVKQKKGLTGTPKKMFAECRDIFGLAL